MKKICVLCTSLLIVFATMVNVMALESSGSFVPGDKVYIKPTTGKFEPNKVLYKVDLTWGSMIFNYDGSNVNWNNENKVYEGDAIWAPVQEGVSNKIGLKNHSNSPITSSFVFESSAEEYKDVEYKFSNPTISLKTAENTKVEEAPFGKTELSLSGPIRNSKKAGNQIGKLTVTVNK